MEIRVLKYFIEVAKTGSLTRAANILNITEPSLSKQIKQLESELGQKLFRRGQYKMILTEVGKSFLIRAKEIVELSDCTLAEYTSNEKDVSGELSIAFADGSFTGDVVEVIRKFRNDYPKIRLLFYSGGLKYITSLTQKNATDIACNYYGSDPGCPFFVKTDQIRRSGLIMKQDDILASYKEIPKNIYDRLPLIVPRGVIKDESGEDITFPVYKENIIAVVEEPFTFLNLMQKIHAYIFCLEPTPEILNKFEIIFRPVRPRHTACLYFVENKSRNNSEITDLFMDYVKEFYESKTR